MNQSDKTRQKLVDSMRKTKSGTTGNGESVAAEQAGKVQSSAQKSGTGSAPKTAAKRGQKETDIENKVDSYQSMRRRVWPD